MVSTAGLNAKVVNRRSSPHGSYPLSISFPEKLPEELANGKPMFSFHQKEISHQVPVMAGADLLRPSISGLMESSTAHDGHLILASNSRTGDLKLFMFSSEVPSPDLKPQPAPFPPSKTFKLLNQVSIQSGRRVNTHLVPIRKLGFPLMGFPTLGPLSFSSPAPKDDPQVLPLRVSRFDQNANLSHSSQSLCSFIEPFVRRLHLESRLPLLLVWLENFFDNLLVESSRTLDFEVSNLSELGIMTQSIRNCGYRCVFMLSSSTRLIYKLVKLPLINFVKPLPKNLKISGIMTPILCSWGYHNIFKFFTLETKTTINPLSILNQSILNPAQTHGKALLRVAFLIQVRFSALAFSTPLSLQSKTEAIFSSIEVLMEEASLFLDLTGSKTLARSWFIALKSTVSMTLIYLYLFVVLALGIALLHCSLNLELFIVWCVLF